MNPLAVLWLWRVGGALALLASLWGGYALWANHQQGIGEKRATEACNVRIDAQKTEAATVLAKAVDDAATSRRELAELVTQMGKYREAQQAANAADLRTRRAGPRLQFAAEIPRCRASGADAQAGASSPASDTSTAVVQLPEPLNGNLLGFASDAQSLSIDYATLYAFANNPKLVCELLK